MLCPEPSNLGLAWRASEAMTDPTCFPDPRKNSLVEIILDVNVSQLTERLKGMFIRQIGVLLGVLDSDIIVQKIQPYTEQR